MFDVGFWELILISVVALLVVGPERLPGVANTVGTWLGKARYMVNSVKSDINMQIKADELQRALDKQSQLPDDVFEVIETVSKPILDDASKAPSKTDKNES